jgi:hypothetical protein
MTSQKSEASTIPRRKLEISREGKNFEGQGTDRRIILKLIVKK